MKKVFVLLAVLLLFSSCEDSKPDHVIVPDWLNPRLTELEESESCVGCRVQRWTYNEEYFYHLYCGYWSCSDCEVYHFDGKLVEWGVSADPTDYNEKKQRPTMVWQCGDELD